MGDGPGGGRRLGNPSQPATLASKTNHYSQASEASEASPAQPSQPSQPSPFCARPPNIRRPRRACGVVEKKRGRDSRSSVKRGFLEEKGGRWAGKPKRQCGSKVLRRGSKMASEIGSWEPQNSPSRREAHSGPPLALPAPRRALAYVRAAADSTLPGGRPGGTSVPSVPQPTSPPSPLENLSLHFSY